MYDPKDIIKCKRQVINPMVGYRSVKDNNDRFSTESIGMWYDRQLFDSMIFREIKRKVVRRQPQKEKKDENTTKK